VKSQVWLAVSSVLWVVVILSGMVWTGQYDLELFFSLWILWMMVAVFLLSPQYVRPRHFRVLVQLVLVGIGVFVLIVVLHTLRVIS
jgi:uncharacterized membrane protein